MGTFLKIAPQYRDVTFSTVNAEVEIIASTGSFSIAEGSFSGSFTGSITSASYAATASSSPSFNISSSLYSAQGASILSGSTTTLISVSTGSYTVGFFDYTAYTGSNARVGTVMSVWNGTSVQYTDNSTLDIGSTKPLTMSVALSGSNIQLNVTSNSSTWTIKSTYRLI